MSLRSLWKREIFSERKSMKQFRNTFRIFWLYNKSNFKFTNIFNNVKIVDIFLHFAKILKKRMKIIFDVNVTLIVYNSAYRYNSSFIIIIHKVSHWYIYHIYWRNNLAWRWIILLTKTDRYSDFYFVRAAGDYYGHMFSIICLPTLLLSSSDDTRRKFGLFMGEGLSRSQKALWSMRKFAYFPYANRLHNSDRKEWFSSSLVRRIDNGVGG